MTKRILVIAAVLLVFMAIGRGMLPADKASAANEVVFGRAWTVTCDDSHPDGGVMLKAPVGPYPRSSFRIKNVTPAGLPNTNAIYIGGVATGAASVNTTTNGYPIVGGGEQPIDGDPALWACVVASGSQSVEVIGGTR